MCRHQTRRERGDDNGPGRSIDRRGTDRGPPQTNNITIASRAVMPALVTKQRRGTAVAAVPLLHLLLWLVVVLSSHRHDDNSVVNAFVPPRLQLLSKPRGARGWTGTMTTGWNPTGTPTAVAAIASPRKPSSSSSGGGRQQERQNNQTPATIDRWTILPDGRIKGVLVPGGDEVVTSPLKDPKSAAQDQAVIQTVSGSTYRLVGNRNRRRMMGGGGVVSTPSLSGTTSLSSASSFSSSSKSVLQDYLDNKARAAASSTTGRGNDGRQQQQQGQRSGGGSSNNNNFLTVSPVVHRWRSFMFVLACVCVCCV